MKRLIVVINLLCVALTSSLAQVYEAGTPRSWDIPTLDRAVSESHTMPPIDLVKLQAEDVLADQDPRKPYRFGHEFQVSYDLFQDAMVDLLPNGDVIRRLEIVCPGANTVNVIFDEFNLADGVQLYLYNYARTYYEGPYTSKNNNEYGTHGSWLVEGDQIIIELNEPADAVNSSKLKAGSVIHGYRSKSLTERNIGDSGPCNVNTICSDGDDFRNQIKGVGMIVTGPTLCSGALINNTALDKKPYVLTAEHCLNTQLSSWVFRFNWESSTCTNNNVPSADVINGAVERAANVDTDVALVEMLAPVPDNYDLYWLGWDKTDQAPNGVVAVHHPNGDCKKISSDNSAPTKATYNSADCWRVGNWDSGTTEGGSSGGPLISNQGYIIGQLFGGTAACSGTENNGQPDYFGRFGLSWDGDTLTERLKDWLDPLGENPDQLEGYPRVPWDMKMTQIQFVDEEMCVDEIGPVIHYQNVGDETVNTFTLNWQVNADPVETFVKQQTLAPGEAGLHYLPRAAIGDGSHSFKAYVELPNDSTDDNPTNDLMEMNFTNKGYGRRIHLLVETDNLGTHTTWEIKDNSDESVIASGGPYNNVNGGEEFISFYCLDGCYTFYIYDAASNGICCGSGFGEWEVSDEWGNVLGSGGMFANIDSVVFCADPTGIVTPQQQKPEFKLYPNPTNGIVNIKMVGTADVETISVYTMMGREVFASDSSNLRSTTAQLDLSTLQNGNYLVVVQTDLGRASRIVQLTH